MIKMVKELNIKLKHMSLIHSIKLITKKGRVKDMFKKLFKKKSMSGIQNNEDTDRTVIDKMMYVLDEARKSEGFMVCISKIYYNDKKEKMLRHNIFTIRLHDDDKPVCVKAYKEQIEIRDRASRIGNKSEEQNNQNEVINVE